MEEDIYQDARENMLRAQIERRGITDSRVLEAMRKVPRHIFVPSDLYDRAYQDSPLPIGLNQTISQPYIVAVMTEMLQLSGDENVLEVGTGSGYQAAILGVLARCVHTIERHPELARGAMRSLDQLGFKNVFVHIGDGSLGWPDGSPYQRILITAAAPKISPPWLEQLDEGGILVVPVGAHHEQYLERWRKSDGQLSRERHFPVAFVPLRGQYGWQEDQWDDVIRDDY